MSKGPGQVQRAIMAAFESEPDNAFLLSELCERAYPRIRQIQRKHRVAVARAAKTIKTIDSIQRQTLGRELVFYDPLNVMSYAMARLKSDFIDGVSFATIQIVLRRRIPRAQPSARWRCHSF